MKKTIYLGLTDEKLHAYAEIRIEPGDGSDTTFTDHTTGPAPERIAISFALLTMQANPKTARDSIWVSGGQISPEDRHIVKPATEHLALIEQAWVTEHLNDMNAACEHMTEAMLTPTDEQLTDRASSHPHEPGYSRLMGWRIDNVVCPETGYRYGRTWLARKPNPDTLAALKELLEA